jgi:hypothetical protein
MKMYSLNPKESLYECVTWTELILLSVQCVACMKAEMLQNLDFIQAKRHVFPFIPTYILSTTKTHHTNTKNLSDVSSWSYMNFKIFIFIFNSILSSL